MTLNWVETDGYRNMQAEIDDYLLIVTGGKKHEFNWVVFYKKNEIVSSRNPCRSVPEAERICEAVYMTHKNIHN